MRLFLNFLKNIILSILAVVIVFLLIESGCRLNESIKQDFGKVESDVPDYTLLVPFRHFVFMPDKDVAGEQHTHFKTNLYGYRGEDFKINKSKDTFRIIAIGDSFTFGVGCTDNYTTYPALLERSLKERFQGINLEVINAGLPGYSSTHSLIFFVTELIKLNPDLVILCINWNDLMYSIMRGWNQDRRFGFFYGQDSSLEPKKQISKINDNLLKYSALMRRLNRIIYKIDKRKQKALEKKERQLGHLERNKELEQLKVFDDWSTRKSVEMFQEEAKAIFKYNFDIFLDICKMRKIRTLVFTRPFLAPDDRLEEYKFKCVFLAAYGIYSNMEDFFKLCREYNNFVKEISAKFNVKMLDAAEIFSNLNNKSEYFFDVIHFTDKGNKYLADIIQEEIVSDGFIQDWLKENQAERI